MEFVHLCIGFFFACLIYNKRNERNQQNISIYDKIGLSCNMFHIESNFEQRITIKEMAIIT